ncbi:MAG: hypothetical protein JWR34_3343 [Mycobacterium sp.]|nr:hypothetical protein [Mycobacterium sp.]
MATTLAAILDGFGRASLAVRVQPDPPSPITQVTLLEDVKQTGALRPGAAVVLSRSALAGADAYQVDVLVRLAVERNVAALVLRRTTRHSVTAERLALRGRLALIDVADEADPLQLFDWLVAAVSGDSRAVLARIAAAAAYEPDERADHDAILRELSVLSGVPLAQTNWDGDGFPIEVEGRRVGAITSPDIGPAATIATKIAAGLLSRLLTADERGMMRDAHSASSALSQLILCSQSNVGVVSERALEVGFQLNGWHCVSRLLVDLPDTEDTPVLIQDELHRLIARRGRSRGSAWTISRPDSSLVLVRTTRSNPGRESDQPMQTAVVAMLTEVISRHPGVRFRVGVATPHEGALGLRTSAEEARIALASARVGTDPVSIGSFDALGIQRILAEWLATDSARDTVSDLLAPIDALGPEKAALAIETLHAYLDERGSLARAAAQLNVHRNAVVYRIAKIRRLLPNDLDDSNDRFALQLACRARLMALGRR